MLYQYQYILGLFIKLQQIAHGVLYCKEKTPQYLGVNPNNQTIPYESVNEKLTLKRKEPGLGRGNNLS